MSLPANIQKKLNPNVSVDCVIFGFDGDTLRVLLIDRGQFVKNSSFEKIYALPGDLIRDDEPLDESARRVLEELTGLTNIYLEQFQSFGDLNRLDHDYDLEWLKSIRSQPEARVITVAYYTLVRSDLYQLHASSFAKEAIWHPISDLPKLGFDHKQIIENALENLKIKIKHQPVGFELLPEKFTLGQLQRIYESILGTDLDKRNFRRKILKMSFLIPLKEKQIGVPHKPAQFFMFDKDKYNHYKSTDFYFTL